MDSVALQIAQYNKQIVSIDMWKSHTLTAVGLKALATECHHLEEADFGWCLRDEAMPGESLKLLLQNCPKMKKLFLAAIRGLTDRDLDNIALYCPELEQLDLMGIMGISTEMCYK
jgi:F-box and leucine-rich repeat protein 4